MLKASQLTTVLRYFRPTFRFDEQSLKDWFVERHLGARSRLRYLLGASDENNPSKFLLLSHRGAEKSTELTKLAAEIQADFIVVNVDALEVSTSSPEFQELLLAMYAALTLHFETLGLIRKAKLWEATKHWWQTVAAGRVPAAINEGSANFKLSTLIQEFQVGIKVAPLTGDEVRDEIKRRIPELIGLIDQLVEGVQRVEGKRVLVMVENLDKIDLEAAEQIFKKHVGSLLQPRVNIIYTFPINMRYTKEFSALPPALKDNAVFFSNAYTHDRQGQEKTRVTGALREVVLHRLEPHLIADDAFEFVIVNSSGIPSQLVQLVQFATLRALEREVERIELEDAKRAANEVRNNLLAPLDDEDLRLLAARHLDRVKPPADERHLKLLYSGALVEYENDQAWCDANRVLWDVLPKPPDAPQP